MGKCQRHAESVDVGATQDLPRSAAHPFYTHLNQILDQHDFDGFVEGLCQRFYADEGRPLSGGVMPEDTAFHRRPRITRSCGNQMSGVGIDPPAAAWLGITICTNASPLMLPVITS